MNDMIFISFRLQEWKFSGNPSLLVGVGYYNGREKGRTEYEGKVQKKDIKEMET